MKIAVLLARYGITGVPLAQMRFARALAARGHDVDLVIGQLEPGMPAPSATGVRVIVWNRPSVRRMLLPFMRYLRQERPEIVFSAEDHLNTIALLGAVLTGSKARISGSSRVTPFDTYSDVPLTKRWVLKHVARALMWRADALTCVSEDMVAQYRQVFRQPPHVCVYNIVDDATSREQMHEPVDDPWMQDDGVPLLVAAGRLAEWKRFPDLIRAMAILRARKAVRLMILGDGPMRGELEQLISSLELGDCVRLLGYVANPLKYYSRADVFVLSSRVEGMPNVLVEAMMCGCTPVSTDCPTGPRELLRGGEFGYLVPVGDPGAMAAAIEQALDRPMPRDRLAEAIRPFAEKAVVDRHFEVLGL